MPEARWLYGRWRHRELDDNGEPVSGWYHTNRLADVRNDAGRAEVQRRTGRGGRSGTEWTYEPYGHAADGHIKRTR